MKGSEKKEGLFDVFMGIDMETDIGSFTSFYEGVEYGTPNLLAIFDKYQVKGTFFWTGHAAENNPEMVLKVKQAGHETGCHGLFHETLGDPIFPLPNNWPILPSEVEGRLQLATDIIRDIAGIQPVSFRCPRLWGSNEVVRVLEKLGYKADATLPLYFYRSMITPYHPDENDWTQKGNMTIVEIPNFCDLAMESSDPYQRDRDQWPLFRTQSTKALMEKIDSFLNYVQERNERPVLSFYFHPWEFYKMQQGAIDFGEASVTPLPFITKNCGDVACREFDSLCEMLLAKGGVFKTAEEIADEY